MHEERAVAKLAKELPHRSDQLPGLGATLHGQSGDRDIAAPVVSGRHLELADAGVGVPHAEPGMGSGRVDARALDCRNVGLHAQLHGSSQPCGNQVDGTAAQRLPSAYRMPMFDEQRHAVHAYSQEARVPSVRTVLIDVETNDQRAFWDAPLWMPIGGLVDGGPEMFEVVSVRLRLPQAKAGEGRPVLYLYGRLVRP